LFLLIALTTAFSQQVSDPNNLFTDGGFNTAQSDIVYKPITSHGAGGTSKIVDGQLVCEITIQKGLYDNQIWRTDLTIEKGVTYFLSFDAKADKERTFQFSIESQTNYKAYAGPNPIEKLTTTMQTFTRTFTMNDATDSKVRLSVSIGETISTVTVDNFILIDKSKITAICPRIANRTESANSLRIVTDLTGLSFRISNPANCGFRIFSPSGRVVANSASLNQGSASQYRIDYRSLGISAGTYVAQVFDGNQQYSQIVAVMP
jgi:hypothetical protein